MSEVRLINVNKVYDNNVQAVFDFNLDIKDGEFIVFVGPSGCGKSTTLRMIAGLEEITDGELYIDSKLNETTNFAAMRGAKRLQLPAPVIYCLNQQTEFVNFVCCMLYILLCYNIKLNF